MPTMVQELHFLDPPGHNVIYTPTSVGIHNFPKWNYAVKRKLWTGSMRYEVRRTRVSDTLFRFTAESAKVSRIQPPANSDF